MGVIVAANQYTPRIIYDTGAGDRGQGTVTRKTTKAMHRHGDLYCFMASSSDIIKYVFSSI